MHFFSPVSHIGTILGPWPLGISFHFILNDFEPAKYEVTEKRKIHTTILWTKCSVSAIVLFLHFFLKQQLLFTLSLAKKPSVHWVFRQNVQFEIKMLEILEAWVIKGFSFEHSILKNSLQMYSLMNYTSFPKCDVLPAHHRVE